MKYHFTLSCLLAILFASHLNGQDIMEMKSKTKGLSAGVHIGLISYTDDKIHKNTEGGFGYGAQIQYGFNHQWAAALAYQHYAITTKSEYDYYNPTNINSPYPYMEVDILAKYIFGSTDQPFRPYLALGFNYTRSKEVYYTEVYDYTSNETYSGYSFCGGGGLSYFLNSRLSLDLSLLFNSGDYSTTLVNGTEVDFPHSFFSFKGLTGISYHF